MFIGFVAGETSGDLLAAPVIGALRERLPGLECAGITGDRMVAAGATAWWHVRELSVRGYAEVLRELPRLLRLRGELRRRLDWTPEGDWRESVRRAALWWNSPQEPAGHGVS